MLLFLHPELYFKLRIFIDQFFSDLYFSNPIPKVKNLYESFVSARDREERGLTERTKNSDRPRTGNTVHVFGYSITEDIIR